MINDELEQKRHDLLIELQRVEEAIERRDRDSKENTVAGWAESFALINRYASTATVYIQDNKVMVLYSSGIDDFTLDQLKKLGWELDGDEETYLIRTDDGDYK